MSGSEDGMWRQNSPAADLIVLILIRRLNKFFSYRVQLLFFYFQVGYILSSLNTDSVFFFTYFSGEFYLGTPFLI